MNLKPIRFCNLDNFQSKFSALSRASLLLSGLAASGLYAATISLPIASSGAMITTTDNATTYCSLQGSPVACSYGGATSSASISSGGSAQAFSGTNTSLEASSSTFYGIAVTGPTSTPVPIIITGTSATNDNGSSSVGIAFISVIDDNLAHTGVVSQYFSSAFGCSQLLAASPTLACTSAGAYSFNASLTPGDVYFVELTAGAGGGSNASASIDPSIVIDPSFAQVNQFSLIASPGVFSTSTTPTSAPEPGSLPVLAVVALGTLWMYCKRHHRI